MFRNRRLLPRLAAVLPLLLLFAGPAGADTQTGNVGTVKDKPESLTSSGGMLITTDDAANDGLGSAPLHVVHPAPGAGGPLWEARVKHETGAPHWDTNGARNVKLCVDSQKDARTIHHKGPHVNTDKDPNIIPGQCFGPFNAPFGQTGSLKKVLYWRDQHHTTTGARHFDHVGFWATIKAVQGAAGAGHRLESKFKLGLKHSDKGGRPDRLLALHTFGSSAAAGTLCSFDANSGQLSFSIGAVDILEVDGQAAGVDPQFIGDPLLAGLLGAGPFPLFGQQPDGSFLFGGGPLSLVDPATHFELQTELVELNLASTVPLPTMRSTGPVRRMEIRDLELVADGASPFLDGFINENVTGLGIPEAEWEALNGLMLAFWTDTDLVLATNGFTTSASLPATVVVSAAYIPSEISPPSVLDGRLGPPLLVDKLSPDGADLRLIWDNESCDGAGGHHILYGGSGELPSGLGGPFLGPPQFAHCGLGMTSPYDWIGSPPPPSIDPQHEMLWFLMVADDRLSLEGSWGVDSNLAERNGTGPNGSSGRCGMLDKDTGNVCDQQACPPVDFWATSFDEPTQIQFGNEIPPIPPNFFFPGSQPIAGQFQLRGVPDSSNNGHTDTRILRSEGLDIDPFPIGHQATVDIQIVELSLTGLDPIVVQPGNEPWLLSMGLSEGQPPGQLQVEKTHPDGGAMDLVVPVQPRFVFVKADDVVQLEQGLISPDQVQVRIVDFNQQSLPPIDLGSAGPMPFSTSPPADGSFFCPGETFFPGIDSQNPPAEGPGGPCPPGSLPPLVPPVATATALFLCAPPVDVPGTCTYDLIDTVPSFVGCKARDSISLNHGGACPPHVVLEQQGDVSTCVAIYGLP